MKPHLGLGGRIFHFLASDDIIVFTDIKLTLKLYCLHDSDLPRNSSAIFDHLQKSPVTFGKCLENFVLPSDNI